MTLGGNLKILLSRNCSSNHNEYYDHFAAKKPKFCNHDRLHVVEWNVNRSVAITVVSLDCKQ